MSKHRQTKRIVARPPWSRKDWAAVWLATTASLVMTAAVVVYAIATRGDGEAAAPPVSVATEPPEAAQSTDPLPAVVEPIVAAANEPRATAAVAEVAPASDSGLLTIRVTDTVLLKNVTRFGLNIGARSVYGAVQHMKNVLPNPGFEAGLFGSMIHSDKGATGTRVPQAFWDTEWSRDDYGIGQPNGFWDGAEYEFLFGAAKGRSGKVTKFALEDHQNIFYLDGDGAAPAEWDVLVVRRELPGIAAGPKMDTTAVAEGDVRPGSPGKQSLHLVGGTQANKYEVYLDSEWRDADKSAGKLTIVEGEWKVSFWAKGKRPSDRVRVHFYREGETNFVDETVRLSMDWTLYEFPFTAAKGADKLGPYADGAYHPLLVFSVSLADDTGDMWLDDVSLARADETNPTAFTDAFVARLKELRLGVLRNWSSQHGDTLDNQVSEPFARKTNGYSPKQRVAGESGFSLHEFLELCKEVGAEPWYVMPPMWSEADVRGLMDYLGAPADGQHPWAERRAKLGQPAPWTEVFPRIHLEFGNEMWGAASASDPFFGASALGGERLGAMANERYGMMKESPYFNADKINFIIGGQYYYPGRQGEIDKTGSNHREIALAPYFGDDKSHANDEELFGPLFARPFQDVSVGRMKLSQEELDGTGKRTGLAIYEINFHTTGGESPIDVTNDFVTGAGGGLAMPLYMLVYQRDMGAKNQCAFTALQYSFGIGDNRYVRVWGLLRDIAATARKRPTWLGLELVNRVMQGDMVAVDFEGARAGWKQKAINGIDDAMEMPHVHAFAYKKDGAHGLVLFNLNLSNAISVSIPGTTGTVTRHQLAPKSLHDDNEDAETVMIATDELPAVEPLQLELPAHSLTALSWEAAQ